MTTEIMYQIALVSTTLAAILLVFLCGWIANIIMEKKWLQNEVKKEFVEVAGRVSTSVELDTLVFQIEESRKVEVSRVVDEHFGPKIL